ncbi:uncharacterized protein TNIN_343801 [Trichonephila inaurata madagascariensis]|uniref:Uncharacterized protein n=1 Tax=Trichonephila inaurata madagascariensis TaxID=2747483 RepID=A0A8X6WWR2_9ARAC|nr:uncharacterized protein TNIN_343801 [Trichonephila inaurata madagascariensis]
MVIEQSLMKFMKTEGGVSRGRSTQESVLCKWVFAVYVTNTICDEMEKFCTISLDSTEQHIDARDSRVKRDNTDVCKLVEWFTLHNPFPNMQQLVSLASVMVGNDQINCHKAHEIGLESMIMAASSSSFIPTPLAHADNLGEGHPRTYRIDVIKKIINMLIGKLESVDITTKQARDDADVLIVETAIEESEHHRIAVIVGEDIDLLVLF